MKTLRTMMNIGMLSLALPEVLLFLTGCASPRHETLGVQHDAPFYRNPVFSPDGKSVAAIKDLANLVLVFDTTNGMETLRFRPDELKNLGPRLNLLATRRIGPAAVAFTSDQHLVAVFWVPHQQLHVWEVTQSNCLAQSHYRSGSIAAALSPDGSRMAYEATNGSVVVQELAGTHATVSCSLEGQRPQFLTFSRDNRWLAAIDKAGTSWIWDIRTNALLRTVPKPSSGPITSLAFSADGTMIARSERNLQIWRLDPWEQLYFFESPRMKGGTRVLGMTINFFSSSKDTDGSSPASLYKVPPTGAAAFSPDNKYVAVINSAFSLNTTQDQPDMGVRVFSLETGELISTFAWPDLINDLAFSPDGQRIATAGTGVEVWDWRTGQPGR